MYICTWTLLKYEIFSVYIQVIYCIYKIFSTYTVQNIYTLDLFKQVYFHKQL